MGIISTRTRKPDTEPCGTCRQPVTIGRWTARSRHSGKALCDDCGTTRGPGYLEPPRSRFGTSSRPAGPTPQSAKAHVDRVLELRAARSPYEQAELERMLYGTADWEDRDFDEYDDEDEYRDAAELRSIDPDLEWVFGPEPDGIPVPGRVYESRWWVDPGVEIRAREVPGTPAVDWELR